jgi:hypothetical protein
MDSDVDIKNTRKPFVGLTPVAPAPARRKIGTAKGDFEVPVSFDAPLAEYVPMSLRRD